MFWKKSKLLRSFAFRLTFRYAIIFTVLHVILMFLIFSVAKHTNRWSAQEFVHEHTTHFTAIYLGKGYSALFKEVKRYERFFGSRNVYYIIRKQGQIIFRSSTNNWDRKYLEKPTSLGKVELLHLWHHRPLYVANYPLTQKLHLQIGFSGTIPRRIFSPGFFPLAMFLNLILASILGYWLSKKALSKVNSITETAKKISEGELSRRVPVEGNGDEIDLLAMTFNQMSEKIHSTLNETKEISNNIAHDLRSPLTRIQGILETSLDEKTLEGYREMNYNLLDETSRMIYMINTMLEIARSESGTWRKPQTVINVEEILEQATIIFQPVAEEKNISLRLEKSANIDTKIQGSTSKLQRLFSNIIDNAIKYTEHGGEVTIQIQEKPHNIVVKIKDSGIGISYKDIEKIFDRFYRADAARSNTGNGLGLSLAKSIARAHGGDISVKSQHGQGTEFTIRLPR